MTGQTRAWTCCCDFHDDPEEIKQHLLRMQREYGRAENGEEIVPPEGWKILPFREEVPSAHREFIGSRWAAPRLGRSTMTPIWAKRAGNVLAFAVPEGAPWAR